MRLSCRAPAGPAPVGAALVGVLVGALLGGCTAPPGPAPAPVTSAPATSAPASSAPVASAPVTSPPPAPALPTSVPPPPGVTASPPPPPDTAIPAPGGPAAGAPVVVLDAGHNGGNAAHPAEINRQVPDGRGGRKACNTTGTATDAGYSEHAFAFDVTARVAARLTAAGVRVVLTRRTDTGVGPCVDERGRAGDRAGADAVVSIHADGSTPAHRGYHVALADPPLNPAQAGPAGTLAWDIRDAMRAGGFREADYVGANGLSPRSDLAGLNLATRPAVLVECANMRNPAEAAVVSSEAGRARYAAAISAGVLAFLDR